MSNLKSYENKSSQSSSESLSNEQSSSYSSIDPTRVLIEFSIIELSSKVNELEKKIQEGKDGLVSISKEICKSKEETKELNKKNKIIESKINEFISTLDRDKLKLVEILGVFVALFTFVSVEIKILSTVSSYLRIVGLSFVMFSGVSCFLFMLLFITDSWLSDSKKSNKKGLLPIVITVVALALGIILTAAGDFKNPAEIKNNTDFIELQGVSNSCTQKLADQKRKIEDLEKEVAFLKNNLFESEKKE